MGLIDHTGPLLSAAEKAAFKELWEVFERHDVVMRDELMREVVKIPSMAELLKRMDPRMMEEQEKASKVLQRAAMVEGDWAPLLANQRQQGAMYASMGIPFIDWFEVVGSGLLGALTRFLDEAMATIGDAYLKTKERIIGQQQEAIQELSTPVLQAVAAVKLMGARAIITGLSSDVAEALVALGVDVDRLDTVSDLQGGLEEANRIMGVKLVKAD